MKLYTITIGDRILDWAGTQDLAKVAKRVQEAEHPGETVTWQPTEVPVDKPGLIAFLKANCTHQPGE